MEQSALVNVLPNIYFTVDNNYTIVSVSEKVSLLTGKDAEESIGEICYQELIGRQTPCEGCPVHSKQAENTPVHDLITVSGNRTFFAASFGETPEELTVESLSDVTALYKERTQLRHQIKELKAKHVAAQLISTEVQNSYDFLVHIMDSLSYGMMVVDSEYCIIRINKSFSSASGAKAGNKCYSAYGRTEPCAECPFSDNSLTKSSRTIGDTNITITFAQYQNYIVENVRDTTREVKLINEIRISQEEIEEKQRQMALLNKDLLRMNESLKLAQQTIDAELAQVGMLQQSLLPESLPDVSGYEFGSFYTPAEHAGGDYYDCIPMSNNHWGFTVADVSGHGTPAAVIMAMSRAIMRSYTYDVISSAEALGMVNEILCENIHTRDFVTMFYIVMNCKTGNFNFASGGHNPVLHFSKSEMMVRLLTADGMFIGVFPGIIFEEKSLSLNEGDILLMYTDGLVEAMNAAREQYGIDRVISHLIMYSSEGCERIIEEIMNDVKVFTGNLPFEDDVTMFVIKKK
jgi:sigma-B regulation protein RsbU (phosphoserine phosphatase)